MTPNPTAEHASRNGGEPRLDPSAYRRAVKSTMNKRECGPSGEWGRVEPNEEEVDRFLLEVAIYGLEPLAGQIYASWDDGVMKAVAPIDGLRLLAERTGRYDGQDAPEWCDREGNWSEYWTGEAAPTAARVRVHKKGTKVPTTGTANWSDFAPESDVGSGALWQLRSGKPAHMLSIRAEALALRKAFPAELSGLYAVEELGFTSIAEGNGASAAAVDVPTAVPPTQCAESPGNDREDAMQPPNFPGASVAGPGVIVDDASAQPSGAPARPESRRTLAQALESGEYERLRVELPKALFDQFPDRLTDEQTTRLAAALAEAEEAGITPVELERMTKVALGEEDVSTRSEALLNWIAERRARVETEDSPGAESAAEGAPGAEKAAETPASDEPQEEEQR